MVDVGGGRAQPSKLGTAWLAMVVMTAACSFDLPPVNDPGPPPLGLEFLAGDIGGSGNIDGTGAAAHFSAPSGLAVDGAGNVYVADIDNHTIRKVTAAGVVPTLAGAAGMAGRANGMGAAARFDHPAGVAVDGAGTVYVTDSYNQTIRKIDPTGVVTTLAGAAGMAGSTDGVGAAARFYSPFSVAVDSAGNVYVSDVSNHNIRKIDVDGVVTTLAGAAGVSGSADGSGTAAHFNVPAGVAVDGAGVVYVADTRTIRKITASGDVTTLAGAAGASGSTDGAGAAARFNAPAGVAVDGMGNLYIADKNNSTIRKITPAGAVTTLAGTAGMVGGADGVGGAARFNRPTGVVVDAAGNLYVADTGNSLLRKITADGTTTTLAGVAGRTGITLGDAPLLAFPAALAIGGDSLLISDTNAILVLRHGAR